MDGNIITLLDDCSKEKREARWNGLFNKFSSQSSKATVAIKLNKIVRWYGLDDPNIRYKTKYTSIIRRKKKRQLYAKSILKRKDTKIAHKTFRASRATENFRQTYSEDPKGPKGESTNSSHQFKSKNDLNITTHANSVTSRSEISDKPQEKYHNNDDTGCITASGLRYHENLEKKNQENNYYERQNIKKSQVTNKTKFYENGNKVETTSFTDAFKYPRFVDELTTFKHCDNSGTQVVVKKEVCSEEIFCSQNYKNIKNKECKYKKFQVQDNITVSHQFITSKCIGIKAIKEKSDNIPSAIKSYNIDNYVSKGKQNFSKKVNLPSEQSIEKYIKNKRDIKNLNSKENLCEINENQEKLNLKIIRHLKKKYEGINNYKEFHANEQALNCTYTTYANENLKANKREYVDNKLHHKLLKKSLDSYCFENDVSTNMKVKTYDEVKAIKLNTNKNHRIETSKSSHSASSILKKPLNERFEINNHHKEIALKSISTIKYKKYRKGLFANFNDKLNISDDASDYLLSDVDTEDEEIIKHNMQRDLETYKKLKTINPAINTTKFMCLQEILESFNSNLNILTIKRNIHQELFNSKKSNSYIALDTALRQELIRLLACVPLEVLDLYMNWTLLNYYKDRCKLALS